MNFNRLVKKYKILIIKLIYYIINTNKYNNTI